MPKIISKIIPVVLLWIVFGLVVLQIPYPDNLIKANFIQVSLFFFPLYLALVLTLNISLKNLLISGSVSLGIISLLLLKALDSLNLVTGILVVISIGLLISYFHKTKRSGLTKLPKIPKLTTLRRKKYE